MPRQCNAERYKYLVTHWQHSHSIYKDSYRTWIAYTSKNLCLDLGFSLLNILHIISRSFEAFISNQGFKIFALENISCFYFQRKSLFTMSGKSCSYQISQKYHLQYQPQKSILVLPWIYECGHLVYLSLTFWIQPSFRARFELSALS